MLITSFVFRNSKFNGMEKMGELDYEKKFGHRFDPDNPRGEYQDELHFSFSDPLLASGWFISKRLFEDMDDTAYETFLNDLYAGYEEELRSKYRNRFPRHFRLMF